MFIIKDHSYSDLKDLLKSYMEEEYIDFINKYYEQAKIIYSGMKRKTGDDYITHPVNVAYILATMYMDPLTIGTSLIHEAISLEK